MIAMSELMGGDECFLLEKQSCSGTPNSNNSRGSEENFREKMPNSTISEGKKSGAATLVLGKKRSEDPKKGSVDDEINKGGKGHNSDHEVHILTERERRKKMRNVFSNLCCFLPHLPPKADKLMIIDDTVSYIKSLEETLQKLEKHKLERFNGHIDATINYDAPIVNPQKISMETREAFLADQGPSTNLGITATDSSISLSTYNFPTIFQTWTSPNVTLNVWGHDAHISVCSVKKPGLLTTICSVLERHQLEVVTAHLSSDNTKIFYMIQAHASGFNQFLAEEIFKQAAKDIMFCVNYSANKVF